MISLMVGLPVGVLGPDNGVSYRDDAFPCQDSSCGCVNATRCWDKCCCLTDAEKMEWAVRNGVQPPEFFVARVVNRKRGSHRNGNLPMPEAAVSGIQNDPSAHSRNAGDTPNRRCCREVVAEPVKVRLATFDSVNRCNGFKVVLKLLTESWVERGTLASQRLEPWLLFTSLHGNERVACIKLPIDPPVPDCRIG